MCIVCVLIAVRLQAYVARTSGPKTPASFAFVCTPKAPVSHMLVEAG